MYIHPMYPTLFSPLKINNLTLRNRIFYAPVEAYYDRAISGCAVMMRGTSGNLNVPKCRLSPGPWLFAPEQLPRIRKELMILKRGGALASLEICHVGMFAHVSEGDFALGASDGIRSDGVAIKSMDRDTITHIVEEYARTALSAKEIGYDMVMLHFAHGWLPAQFFSPAINKRTDEFGGSFENRFRFSKMILGAVRSAVGFDYPIDMRISAYENYSGCASFAEITKFIQEVSNEGLIDSVNISYGSVLANGKTEGTPYSPNGYIADYAAEVKANVKIPVIVVGKIMSPGEAEDILANGKADGVVIGRASIADPLWAKKAFECRPEDIVPCIECGKCFDKRCSVQLRNYLEDMIPRTLPKSAKLKKVVIVGGGPAGMKAAITAREKGHEVVLYEKASALGGLIRAADYTKDKTGVKRYKDYLINQLHKSGARVLLNALATPEIIEGQKPDQLILAMGSSPITPMIPGVEYAMQIVDAYKESKRLGNNVAIIGGGLTGSEFAISLALKGNQVTIIEKTNAIGRQNEQVTYPTFRPYDLLSSLSNVTMISKAQCLEIKRDGVVFIDADGVIHEISADTVILAVGFKSNTDNLHSYYEVAPHTTMIGDLRRPANIRECTEEGYFAVAEI